MHPLTNEWVASQLQCAKGNPADPIAKLTSCSNYRVVSPRNSIGWRRRFPSAMKVMPIPQVPNMFQLAHPLRFHSFSPNIHLLKSILFLENNNFRYLAYINQVSWSSIYFIIKQWVVFYQNFKGEEEFVCVST